MNPRYIPSAWVSAGYGVPDVCARHGEPSIERRPVKIRSSAPAWTYILILFGLVAFFIAVVAVRKTVMSPAWPFCTRCEQLRSQRIRIGLGLVGLYVVASIGLPVLGTALPNQSIGDAITVVGVLIGVASLIIGLVMLTLSRWSSIARAQLTQDGAWVLVPLPDPVFDAQILAAMASSQQ
jgi:hypothetical protein